MEYIFEENNDGLDQNNNQEQEKIIQPEEQEKVIQPKEQEEVIQSEEQEKVMQPKEQEEVIQPEEQEKVIQPKEQEEVIQPKEQENNSVEDDKTNPTVLIIEDEDSERISLKTVLVAENIAVESACDGEEALYLIKKRFFDIVIVDYRLPDVDGLTLIKRIKAINADSMPIVVTAYSSIEIAIEAMKTGAYDYIVKPLDIPRLLNIMNKIMEDTKVLLKSKQILKEIVSLGRIDYVTDKDNIIVVTTPDTGILSDNDKSFSLKKIMSFFKGIKNYYWG